MRDAVADVLIQRRGMSSRESSGLLPSLLLHGALVALLVISSRPRPVELPPQVLTVRLSPAAAGAKSKRSTVAAPRPEPKPETKAESKPVAEEAKKAPPALKNQETLFGQAAKPKGREEKPAATPPQTRQPQPDTQGASFAEGGQGGIGIMPGVGAAGITGLEGGNFPYNFYLERMVTIIGENWIRPQTGADITTVVYFVIQKDGTIRDAEIRKSSGSGVFDRAALRGVIESSPLPRLPVGYSGSYLGVHLTFH
ncbi:MAG: TonB family protein [Thermoanaerobaculia bacterium]|nr:TonB family protein [Thermoanaerobaculia bacterium]